MRDIEHGRLLSILEYDIASGRFSWRIRMGSRALPGATAGSVSNEGYVLIKIGRTRYLAHRLAWLYVTGKWPCGEIDHKDGNRANNAFGNLRDVTKVVNSQNRRKAAAGSATGVLGVTLLRAKFVAQITAQGKHRHIGVFPTTEQAHAAYIDAKRQLHPGNTL